MRQEVCQKCNGTGWITVKRDDREFAKKCDCLKTDILLTKAEKANIPLRFQGNELEWAFQPDAANPSQARAKKRAQKFINDYPSVEKGLLFQGEAGRGKTTILSAIGSELIKKKDVDVYYIDQNSLVKEIREHITSKDFSAINRLIEKLTTVKLLLFDELGASDKDKLSPWINEIIYYIFNKRYNNKMITVSATNYFDEKSTVKSTEAEQSTLEERIGELIRSRLYEMTEIVLIRGSDFRRKYK